MLAVVEKEVLIFTQKKEKEVLMLGIRPCVDRF